ncbi:MAG: tetratricopeptide repeat protein [Oligoflexales bacterium]
MNNFILKPQFLAITFIFAPLFSCQSTMTASSHTIDIDQELLRESVHEYKMALKKNPTNTGLHHKLGIALVRSRQYKQAVRHLEKGSPQEKDSFENTFYLAEAYRGLEKFAQAIFYYNKALTYDSQNKDTLTALSWSYFRIRYYSEALATSQRVLKIAPRHTEGAIILARTLLKLNQPQKAGQVIKKSRKTAQKNMRPYLDSVIGDIYYSQHSYNKSIQSYRRALRKEPMLAGALFGLGKCLIQKGRPKAAIHYMKEALKIRPQYSDIHFQLAKVLEQDDPKSSLNHYKKFRGMSHSDPEHLNQVREAQRKIQILKNKTF